MEARAEFLERVDFEADERRADDDVLVRALLELAESAKRNHQRSRIETEGDGPMPAAA